MYEHCINHEEWKLIEWKGDLVLEQLANLLRLTWKMSLKIVYIVYVQSGYVTDETIGGTQYYHPLHRCVCRRQ